MQASQRAVYPPSYYNGQERNYQFELTEESKQLIKRRIEEDINANTGENYINQKDNIEQMSEEPPTTVVKNEYEGLASNFKGALSPGRDGCQLRLCSSG